MPYNMCLVHFGNRVCNSMRTKAKAKAEFWGFLFYKVALLLCQFLWDERENFPNISDLWDLIFAKCFADNQKCQVGFRPLCNKILLLLLERYHNENLNSHHLIKQQILVSLGFNPIHLGILKITYQIPQKFKWRIRKSYLSINFDFQSNKFLMHSIYFLHIQYVLYMSKREN